MKRFLLSLFVMVTTVILSCGKMIAQTKNVKCVYEATSVISDAVRNMEDTHIRDMVIAKLKEDKKSFTMLFFDGKYSFSECDGDEDSEVKSVGMANNIFIDTAKDSIIAQKAIVDKMFLIKDIYIPNEWTLTDEKKVINGKECIKATAAGNIPVTAWFTTEIPLGVGPMGYLGLPGLIIQLDTPTYSYVLQQMVELEKCPSFEIPTKGKVVTQKEFDKLEAEKIKSRGDAAGKVRIIRL